uniref:Uncharacterized protein n=1 Tax=Panagrolaimus sp. PS1159 TaxID=55785 RepID=A0AC35FU88_9BILA
MEDNVSDKNYGSIDGTHLRKRGSPAPVIDDPEPTSYREMLKKWPKSTFCIISNEFCERFSYYGMRTVLTLYLINILKFNNDNATIMFHTFTVLAYTSPIFGSILADGYIGKFW